MTHRHPPSIRIRAAGPADALCLGVLATQVWLDTYAITGIRPAIAKEILAAFSTQTISDLLDRANTHFRIAESGNHLVAFAQVTVGTAHELISPGPPAELDRLYVQEPFTRLGVGSALLAEAEALAASNGAEHIWLTPWVKNDRALHFYAKHAYIDVGATYFVMQGEKHENRVLSKSLTR